MNAASSRPDHPARVDVPRTNFERTQNHHLRSHHASDAPAPASASPASRSTTASSRPAPSSSSSDAAARGPPLGPLLARGLTTEPNTSRIARNPHRLRLRPPSAAASPSSSWLGRSSARLRSGAARSSSSASAAAPRLRVVVVRPALVRVRAFVRVRAPPAPPASFLRRRPHVGLAEGAARALRSQPRVDARLVERVLARQHAQPVAVLVLLQAHRARRPRPVVRRAARPRLRGSIAVRGPIAGRIAVGADRRVGGGKDARLRRGDDLRGGEQPLSVASSPSRLRRLRVVSVVSRPGLLRRTSPRARRRRRGTRRTRPRGGSASRRRFGARGG